MTLAQTDLHAGLSARPQDPLARGLWSTIGFERDLNYWFSKLVQHHPPPSLSLLYEIHPKSRRSRAEVARSATIAVITRPRRLRLPTAAALSPSSTSPRISPRMVQT